MPDGEQDEEILLKDREYLRGATDICREGFQCGKVHSDGGRCDCRRWVLTSVVDMGKLWLPFLRLVQVVVM